MRVPLLALILALCTQACFLAVDSAPSEAEVVHFHRLLDEGRFEKVYAESSDELKSASKQDDFVAILEAVHRKLGSVQKSEKTGTHKQLGTGGNFVSLTYKTTFSEGPATERFRFRILDGKPVLVAYNVDSALLITK